MVVANAREREIRHSMELPFSAYVLFRLRRAACHHFADSGARNLTGVGYLGTNSSSKSLRRGRHHHVLGVDRHRHSGRRIGVVSRVLTIAVASAIAVVVVAVGSIYAGYSVLMTLALVAGALALLQASYLVGLLLGARLKNTGKQPEGGRKTLGRELLNTPTLP
ncbi:MAG: hypothetical protein HC774_01045 [Sphingomonadales bacterium]|nr:hypothetical protein [Sphingomonadales bacterium]